MPRAIPLRLAALVTALGFAAAPAFAQGAASVPAPATDSTVAERLAAVPAERWLADSSLRIVNLYRIQGAILAGAAERPADSTIALLAGAVYRPYAGFWQGYLGDETAFRRWAARLLDSTHPIHRRLEPLLDVGLDRRFIEGVEWIDRTTGRRPQGTWFLVFGPGWTDMGGLTGIGMVADFTMMEPDSAAIAAILPHELAHQVHGVAPGRADDPDRGTVLERIIGEGFATYVAWVHAGGRLSPAQALVYDPAEWEWALAHERALFDAVRPLLSSRLDEDLDFVAARSRRVLPGGPAAAGYFIGFRIVEAYVARHGPDSWTAIFDLPVGEVLARSGYAPAG
jgi:hypothetical protein